ncbi:MAG: DUF1592 domain-containing protein [bacterium]|nr:DUF1592 domain-containing protein [bacterium]
MFFLGLACFDSGPPVGPIAMRRITADQYRQTIADVFGPEIKIVGRFEPDARRNGLLAVGTAWVSITPAGFEQYDAIARRIAEQVVAPENRERLVGCTPADPEGPGAACSEQFIRHFGRRLLRRRLEDEDIGWRVAIAEEAARQMGDFYVGLRMALSSILVAPEFLFRVERAVSDPESPDRLRLTDHSIATRLSFFLWNTTPDEELLQAAERGELATDAGLARQIDRLLASPRLEKGVEAFFSDVLGFDELEDVSKDPILFPRFSRKILKDARQQTLRTVADHLIVRGEDFREIFTTRRTFMNRTLGVVYRVPVKTAEGWEATEFPPGSPRVGLQSHLSILALHSHPGRTSATLRGIFVREALLCQDVPAAPADVDFNVVQDVHNPDLKTARERLIAHSSERGCANCHKLVDPIGLALENFDGAGIWRSTENGVPIDAGGELEGMEFVGAEGLGRVLYETGTASACAVRNLFRYAVGRDPEKGERFFVRDLEDRFAEEGYRFAALIRALAMSESFRSASEPRQLESAGGERVANLPAAATNAEPGEEAG